MYNRKVYDPEFKLNVVKEYLNGDNSQAQICEEYSISPSSRSTKNTQNMQRRIRTDDRCNGRERQSNSWDTFGTEEQIEELHRMHRQRDKIQGSRYKGTNDKDRQWSTIQFECDKSMHFFFYQEIRSYHNDEI